MVCCAYHQTMQGLLISTYSCFCSVHSVYPCLKQLFFIIETTLFMLATTLFMHETTLFMLATTLFMHETTGELEEIFPYS